MAKITWTNTAINDMDVIAEYISRDSEFYAKQFVIRIFEASYKLEKYPEIGKIVPELRVFNYWEILFKKYRIIYRIETTDIYIISVHHSSRLLSSNDTFKDFFE